MRRAIPAVLAVLMTTSVASADQAPLVDIKRLSLDKATELAQAAIAACRKEGVQVAVTVVDRGGHPQVVLRDVLAMDLTLPISQKKAYTALSFNAPTSSLEGRFKGAYSIPKLDSVLVAAGGLPIVAGGAIVGAVGISGAPSGEIDEKCARAGIDAVSADLEMAGF